MGLGCVLRLPRKFHLSDPTQNAGRGGAPQPPCRSRLASLLPVPLQSAAGGHGGLAERASALGLARAGPGSTGAGGSFTWVTESGLRLTEWWWPLRGLGPGTSGPSTKLLVLEAGGRGPSRAVWLF